MRRLAVPFLMLALIAGCRAATPTSTPTPDPAQLGAGPSGSPSATADASLTPSPTDPTRTADPSRSPDAPRAFTTIGTVDDARGDGGTEARAYDDIIGVRIQDDGVDARILVRLGAKVPDPLPEGEQIALGIDLFERTSTEESDYQVFAAGTDQGWLAFLETPDGFADYSAVGGRFALGGDILEFTVPWAALGDLVDGRFSAFLDWDRDTIAIALAGQDKAPDRGRAAFRR